MRRLGKFSVVIDSNEAVVGKTWSFPNHNIVVQTLLKAGCDYSIKGQVGIVGVERKSYSDYVRCLGKGFPAFEKQLTKLQRNRIYCVIVEGQIDDPIHSRSQMIHDSVITQTAKVVARGVPVIFAGCRVKATLMCIRFFEEALRKIQDDEI